MATIGERLLQLKKELELAKLDKASAEGALQQNIYRLKEEFECKSISAANTKLEALKNQKISLQSKIEKAVERLEEKYEW